jgi:hypothetical protein
MALGVFAWLCLTWVLVVHFLYFVTLDDDPLMAWLAPLRGTAAAQPAVDLLLLQYPVSVFGLFLLAVQLHPRVRSPTRFGLVAGGLFALWANAQFLAIPYGGAYTSLPGMLLGSALTGGANMGPLYILPVLATNVILYPLIGGALGRLFHSPAAHRRGEPG